MLKCYTFLKSFFENSIFVLLLFLLTTGTTEGYSFSLLSINTSSSLTGFKYDKGLTELLNLNSPVASAGFVRDKFLNPVPISGTKYIGSGGNYASLTAAFSDITAQTLDGNIILVLKSGYLSSSETFPLTGPSLASMAGYSITVYPEVTGLEITSTNTTATISFDGRKNIIYDGRVGGTGTTKDLIISNTRAGSYPAVRFINDASDNIIRYCKIQSINSGTSSGTIVFSTTSGTTGNDNNLIEYCDIHEGASTPYNAIYSVGTTTTNDNFNSGNTISNCNIYNFFAQSNTTRGIHLGSGNTAWTITGNSFYQTVERTYSSGNIHYSIYISTDGNNFLISGNNIGGSEPGCAGDPWTVSGSYASRFVGIYLNAGTSVASSLQNNKVANFSWSSTSNSSSQPGVWSGIHIVGGTVNIGTVNGNTIGSGTGTGSISITSSTTGGISSGISSAASGVVNISNNTIGSINVLGSSSTISHSFYGIWNAYSNTTFTADNNLIGSTGTANSINSSNAATGTTAAFVQGIYILNTSSLSNIYVRGNTIANLNSNYVPSSANANSIVRGIYSSSGINTITGNTVRNLSTGANANGTNANASVIGIAMASPYADASVSGNTVYDLRNSNSSEAVTVTGIHYYGARSGTNLMAKNLVHSLSIVSTNPNSDLRGIVIAEGKVNAQNNLVRLGINSSGSSLTTGINIHGIYDAASYIGTVIYHNSVYIGGTGVGSEAGNSYAFRSDVTSNTRTYQNNIFQNSRSNSTTGGKHYAIRVAGSGVNPSGLNLDYNIYYSGGTGRVLGYYNADYSTLPAWRLATGKDANSGFADPNFISPNTASPNLNISGSTPVESRGILIPSITDDYIGQTRADLTPVDIGAYAGDFTQTDITEPVISYTPLSNTSKTENRDFTNVVITDGGGINTSDGTKPRLYFKRSTDANSFIGNTSGSDGWKYVETTSGSSPFSFTINYSLLNGGTGVSVGSVIEYFVVAQDVAGNVAINSGFFNDIPSSVNLGASVFPITGSINSYTFLSTITGEVLVGTGQTYTSLTNAGGLFEAINNRIVTGNITVKITSDLYEAGSFSLNKTTEEALYSILIVPDGPVMRTISGSVNQGMIKFNGAQNVTIDGRHEGSGRYITINNYRSSSNGIAVQIISEGAGLGCNNITIRNCKILTGTMGSSGTSLVYSWAIHVGGLSSASSGADNDNISIIDNEIYSAFYGIYVKGSASGVNDNIVITGNTIGSENTSTSISAYGVFLEQCNGGEISVNNIFNVRNDGYSPYGIAVITGVSNIAITKNKIYGITYRGSGGFGGKGISLNTGASGSNITVANNIIYEVLGKGSSSLQAQGVVGITITGGGGFKIYHNSVNLTGNTDRNEATLSAGLYVDSDVSDVDLRNNIFVNSIINSLNAGDKAYSIYLQGNSSVFSNLNYNDYHVSTGGNYAGILGYSGGDITNIADWRTATGQDANSLSADPDFKAYNNLKPMSGSPVLLAGTPVSGVTVDYFGDARSGTNPSIGAVENAYAAPVIDWANLQHPASFTIKEGIVGQSVYAQVYEPFVTNYAGQGAGIQCWIGWSTSNTNPDTWTNWMAATFQGDAGNNDEYTVTLGTGFVAGTYYYASRWLIQDAAGYQYGGYSAGGGGFWDGTTYVSGVLTVQDNSITWANLQYPQSAVRYVGENEALYARVYVPDVTTLATMSPSITCWIGINSENTNPSTWSEGAWTEADFNFIGGNNDEYYLAAGEDLPPGTYYYASRFQLAGDAYVYGGYNAGGGGFWDGVDNVSGVLTIDAYKLSPPFAEDFENNVPPFGWGTYEGILASPSSLIESTDGWYQNWWRNTSTSFGDAANVNIYSSVDFYWLTTPSISLGTGEINYELRFDISLNEYGESTAPETNGTDDKFAVVISTDNGVTWSAANTLRLWDNAGSPYVYNNIPFNGTNTKVSIPLTGYTGDVMIGFYGESTSYNADNDLFVDNVQVRKIPDETNTQVINAGVLEPLGFSGTGITLQFPTGNSTDLNLTIDKILGNPGGNLPGGLLNLASEYWEVTLNSGTVNAQYCISVDVSGCGPVTNYATLHLLKRDNSGSPWVDIGVPTDVSGAPVLKWCYPALNSFSEFGIAGFSENPLPVELASFTSSVSGRDVTLNWSTKTEVSSNKFVIERTPLIPPPPVADGKGGTQGGWETVGEVKASGNSNSPKEYSFTDKKLNSGLYGYRLKLIDNDGTFEYSKEIEVDILRPSTFDLRQNYPNPFNPSTTISYQLPIDSKVTLELYAITGEKVATLVNEIQTAGYYNLPFTINNSQLSSGVYIYRIVAGDFVSTKKMVVLK